MNTFMNTLISITISSSILLLMVMAVKSLFAEKLNIKTLMFLWILVLARLLMPFNIESPLHFDSLINTNESSSDTAEYTDHDSNYTPADAVNTNYSNYNSYEPSEIADDTNTVPITESKQSYLSIVISEIKSVSIWTYALAVWAAGTLLILSRTLYLSIAFRKRINNSSIIPDIYLYNILSSAQNKLNVNLSVKIMQSKFVDVPVVFGVLRPVILIPARLYAQTDKAKLKLIIMHELVHIKRNDILKNILWLAAKSLHWFNPLVWYAYNKYLDDVELACDNMVTESISKRESIDYSQSLLDVIKLANRRPKMPVVLSFCKDRNNLKKRVENMVKPKKTLKSASVISLILAAIMVFTCFTTACQPTPDIEAVSSKTTDIEQVVLENNQNEQSESGSDTSYEENQAEEVDPTKTDYYQTPKTYENQFSQANVDVFVHANIYGPEDNKIVSAVLEDRVITQELADDFISYFTGDAQLYERTNNRRTQEEIAEEITFWKNVVFNCETNWDEVRLGDPYAEHDNSSDAIEEFERIIRSLEQESKAAPARAEYDAASSTLNNDRLAVYAQNAQGNFDNMAFILISNNSVNSLMYDNKGSWRDSTLNLDEVYRNSGLTLEYAFEQARIAAQHFGVDELYLDGYYICRHFKDGESVPFIKMNLSPAFNSIGSPLVFDDTQLGFSAAAAAPPNSTELFTVCVDPDGIIEFSWTSPQNIVEVIDDNVSIMSYEEMISIFEQKIMYTLYSEGSDKRDIHIVRIQLSLMPVKKIDSSQTVLVPVWDFRGYFYNPNDELWATCANVVNENDISTFLTINAIDGSIISRERGY